MNFVLNKYNGDDSPQSYWYKFYLNFLWEQNACRMKPQESNVALVQKLNYIYMTNKQTNKSTFANVYLLRTTLFRVIRQRVVLRTLAA